MAEYHSIIQNIVKRTADIAGVPVHHAPSPSAGEKIIYRCTPGECDGNYESFTVVMKFLSADLDTAFRRAEDVTYMLCTDGFRSVLRDGRCPVYTVREDGGGSGFIGRTGHFFVMTRYKVRRRVPS